MTYIERLLYNKNNKCSATIVLAKLIFQEHTDQKSGLFQDQQPISGLLHFFLFFMTHRNPAIA